MSTELYGIDRTIAAFNRKAGKAPTTKPAVTADHAKPEMRGLDRTIEAFRLQAEAKAAKQRQTIQAKRRGILVRGIRPRPIFT